MQKTLWTILTAFSFAGIWAQQDAYQFSGYVYDSETQQPIEEALVKMNDASFGLKTAKNGYFYTSKAYGTFTVTIEKEGFQTHQEVINHQVATEKKFYLIPVNFEDDFEFLDEIVIDEIGRAH